MSYAWRPIEPQRDDETLDCDHCDDPLAGGGKILRDCSSRTGGCVVCETCYENAIMELGDE